MVLGCVRRQCGSAAVYVWIFVHHPWCLVFVDTDIVVVAEDQDSLIALDLALEGAGSGGELNKMVVTTSIFLGFKWLQLEQYLQHHSSLFSCFL